MSSLFFLGDVWLPLAYTSSIPIDGQYIINLEYPITKSNQPAPNKINLKADTSYIIDTFGKPPVAVCLANNHIMDFGEQGFLDTINSLDKLGVKYFGCGSLKDNCFNPTYIEIDGKKVALLGYACPSTNALFVNKDVRGVMQDNPLRIKEDILLAQGNKADKIIISIHWGAEEVFRPKPDDIKIARSAIDAGADLVVGHHSHCIQPFEIYKGKYIFYGLGNCIMPDINCNCNYNDLGLPTGKFVKKQKSWNKLSTMVNFDINTDFVTMKMTYFDKKVLSIVDGSFAKYKLDNTSMESYDRQFRQSLLFCRLKNAVANYVMSPQLPSLRHLQGLLNILRSKGI